MVSFFNRSGATGLYPYHRYLLDVHIQHSYGRAFGAYPGCCLQGYG